MTTTDTFHFTELIEGNECHYLITPNATGFRIEENGAYKGDFIAERSILKGELNPKAVQSVTGWIRARYDIN